MSENREDRATEKKIRTERTGTGTRTGKMAKNGAAGRKTPGNSTGRTGGGSAAAGVKRFGKPAGGKTAAEPAGAKRFGKPAGGKTAAGPAGAKRFGKPLGEKTTTEPAAARSFKKPTGGKTVAGPAGAKSFGKPAGGKTATGPAGAKSFGKPAAVRPASHGGPVRTKPAEMEGLASRRAALKVLRAVTEEGAYASLALDKALQGSGLSGADRRLASRLVYDTLDRLIWLDYMLGQVMAREDTDIRLRNILRLGACQILLEERIPESAATNTCVELCAENGMEGLKGVCNGILRNLVRKKDELILPDPQEEPEKAFAVRHSLPAWLGERLRREWGPEEAEKIAAHREPESSITIRRNLLKTDEAGFEQILAKKIWRKEPGNLPGAWRITGAMDIARDADFLDGAFSIQSEPSMMACLALAPKRGQQILDCCAAPGGKTAYLSELMGDTGRIQAWDVHEHRVQLIAAQQKRLGLENIRPILRDAAKYREDLDTRMDAVLLDAPCTGLGVLAEKPDIKLRVTEESTEELIRLQETLLDTVCRYVRPGGTLVYSTCSLLKGENEAQIRAFLDRHPEFEPERLPETIPEKFRRYETLGLQLLPWRDGTEGFYICRMRRKAAE